MSDKLPLAFQPDPPSFSPPLDLPISRSLPLRASLRVSVRASHPVLSLTQPFHPFTCFHLRQPPSLIFRECDCQQHNLSSDIYILCTTYLHPHPPAFSRYLPFTLQLFHAPLPSSNFPTSTTTGNTTANRHCTLGLTRRSLFSDTSHFRFFCHSEPTYAPVGPFSSLARLLLVFRNRLAPNPRVKDRQPLHRVGLCSCICASWFAWASLTVGPSNLTVEPVEFATRPYLVPLPENSSVG